MPKLQAEDKNKGRRNDTRQKENLSFMLCRNNILR
jgi:hypothetical protein